MAGPFCYHNHAGQGSRHGGFLFSLHVYSQLHSVASKAPVLSAQPRAVLAGSAGDRWSGGFAMQTEGVNTPLCACGCGQVVSRSQNHKGWSRFRRGHNLAPRRSIPERFWVNVCKSEGCWNWIGSTDKDGYGQFGVGDSKLKAHRLSWEFHHGPVPDGLFVLHECDNPGCVNPAHLFIGTQADNVRDMSNKGRNGSTLHPERRPRGENNPASKLDDVRVKEARSRHRQGESLRRLAEAFGVAKSTMAHVIRGDSWGHI